MKIQLPTDSSAPPLSAWPLVQPRASLAPTPITTPPPTAASTRCGGLTRGPRSVSRLSRPASPRRGEPADDHAHELEHQPVAQRAGDAERQVGRHRRQHGGARGAPDRRGARRDHAGERARRPEALPDDDVGGQQHQAHADAGEIRVGVRARALRHFSTAPRLLIGPVLERAVVEHRGVPQQPRGEDHRRGLLADVAIGHHGVARLDAGLAEQRLYARAVDQPLRVGDLGERDVDGAGDVSGLVGHRRLNAGEEHGGPCVHERVVRPLL